MGFGSYQTAWSWLHKIRKAMVQPRRQPLSGRVGADEMLVAGAVDAAAGKGRRRQLGRLRLAAVPDASAASLKAFLAANVARPAAVATDDWLGYAGLGAAGYAHQPLNLAPGWGDAAL